MDDTSTAADGRIKAVSPSPSELNQSSLFQGVSGIKAPLSSPSKSLSPLKQLSPPIAVMKSPLPSTSLPKNLQHSLHSTEKAEDVKQSHKFVPDSTSSAH